MDFNDVTRIFKDDLLRLERSIQKNYQSDVPLIPGIGDYLLKNQITRNENGNGNYSKYLFLL